MLKENYERISNWWRPNISNLFDVNKLRCKNYKSLGCKKKSSAPKKKVPQDTDCIVMLTSFLNHNTMLKYKNEAKKKTFHLFSAKDQFHVFMMSM